MVLRASSIPAVLDYLSAWDEEPADVAAVRKLFSHEDYRFEMRRYGVSSLEHFVSYFSHLKEIRKEEIPDLCEERKNALREKHDSWLDCASNPQKYYKRYEKVKHILREDNLQNLQHRLSAAFPGGVTINDAGVISMLSFGPSFGYVYENALHLDLFGVEDICLIKELPYVILHEMHHLQIQKMIGDYSRFTERFSLLDDYIFRFTGEGLAVKFCNNAEGVVSKRMDSTLAANIGVPEIPLLNKHFEEHFALFNDTIQQIRQGAITKSEIDFLSQTPIYSFGNKIFGCIYDAFGIETMFECFYEPAKAITYFNGADSGYSIMEI